MSLTGFKGRYYFPLREVQNPPSKLAQDFWVCTVIDGRPYAEWAMVKFDLIGDVSDCAGCLVKVTFSLLPHYKVKEEIVVEAIYHKYFGHLIKYFPKTLSEKEELL